MPEDQICRLDEALRQHRAGNWDLARSQYQALIREDGAFSQAWHLLGLLDHQSGDHAEALRCLSKAIQLRPDQAVYYNNHGAVLLAVGRFSEAVDSLQRALTLQPNYTDAVSNLGRAWQVLKQWSQAAESFRTAAQLAPANPDFHRRLAACCFELGRLSEAIESYQLASHLSPNDPSIWNDLAAAQLAANRPADAVTCYQHALRIAPGEGQIWFNLGTSLAQLEQPAKARAAFEQAMRLEPRRPEWQLRIDLLCPAVFASTREIEEYCEQLDGRLRAFAGGISPCTGQRLFEAGIHPPLALAFQGRSTRSLKEKLAAVVRPAWSQRFALQRANKPRVGFVVTRGHEPLFLRCMGGMIERLDCSAFEVVICAPTSGMSMLREGIKRSDLTFFTFSDSFDEAAEAIAAARCDVLYHWEIGTDSLNYLLPFARLSPVQCTSWGTQVTSGMAEVDYYLSSESIETPHAAQFCTEHLVRFNRLPTFQRRVPNPAQAQKTDFGLPADANVYLCPQNLLKLHPDQDALFSAILECDPRALIVLKESRADAPGLALRERFRRTVGPNHERIRFIPWQSLLDYYRLLTIADVILDPIHYSAGSSAYDFFSLGLPVVTLPGEINVSRYTQACLRVMQLPELIAADSAQYVERAVRIASDAEYRDFFRGEIRERSACLFEDSAAVMELGEFLSTAVAQARSS